MKNTIYSRRLSPSSIVSRFLPAPVLPSFSNLRFHDLYSNSTYKQSKDPSLSLKILGLGIKFAPRAVEPPSASYSCGFDRIYRSIIIATTDFSDFNSNLAFNRKIRIRSEWIPDHVNPYAIELIEFIAKNSKSLLSNRKFPFFSHSSLFKQFAHFRKIPSLKIVQSDKNSGLVAMHIRHYNDMVQSHLSNRVIYESISADIWPVSLAEITAAHKLLLHDVIPHRRNLPKSAIEFLLQTKSTLPTFHCIPKLHKAGMPGRPIVGSPSWLTTKWSILLDCLLETIQVEYALRNSIDLIPLIENLHIEGSYILCSADVSSLYTNMSLQRLYGVIERHTQSELYVRILKFICENNFFRYGNSVFRQRDGIAMGTNCAVICANLYLDDFDQHFAPKCVFYRRYIDDIFFILDTNLYFPSNIQLQMNSFISKIVLDFVFSPSSVNFLDLVIFKNSHRKIQFKTFQKPQNIYQYLPRSSCHNPATIKGYIRGELIRFCRTNSTLTDRRTLFSLFYERLRARSFPISYLASIFASINLNSRYLERTPVRDDAGKNRIPLIVPYYPNLLKFQILHFMKILNQHPYAVKLDLRFFPAYRKNRNVLDICSRSNISDDQIEYISSSITNFDTI